MKTVEKNLIGHELIDMRSLELHREIVRLIDNDPEKSGLKNTRRKLGKYLLKFPNCQSMREWEKILSKNPWEKIRGILLSNNENSKRLRQSTPFTSIPSDIREKIFRKYRKKLYE